MYFTNLLCLRGLEWECPVRWGRVNICTFQSVRCSCYSQARKPQNLKLHFFKQICHAVIIMFLQKAYFWVVSPYWYPHPMWLVPDWLSFAGVSVPAFLLEETNVVPTNRKRAEADASCLRYARVLTELARLVWKNENSTLLYFLTFEIVGEKQWQLRLVFTMQNPSPSVLKMIQCMTNHDQITSESMYLQTCVKMKRSKFGKDWKDQRHFPNKTTQNQSSKQCLPFSNRLWIL